MKTREYIDLARKFTTTGTDYAVAALLGISEDAVNGYRKGKRVMDNTTALRLSELLNLPLEELIASAEIERARDPATKQKWAERLKRSGQRAASVTGIIVLAGLTAIGGSDSWASTNTMDSGALPSSDRYNNYATFRRTVRRTARALILAWNALRHPGSAGTCYGALPGTPVLA